MEIKNQSNFSIHGWMPKLGLKGTQLLIYALIYSYTKNGQEFKGSLTYLCEWSNCTRSTVINALKELTKKEFIFKTKVKKNNMTFCSYTTNMNKITGLNFPLPVQNSEPDRLKIELSSSIKTAPNNTNINISKIYTEKMFLEDWTLIRKNILGAPTHLVFLKSFEKDNFHKLIKYYSQEDFRKGMESLFSQEVIKYSAMITRPKHFLEEMETYLNAYESRDTKLYGCKQIAQ